MPLLVIPVAAALGFVALPYDIPVDVSVSSPATFSAARLAHVELAAVHGSGLPPVGLDRQGAAAAARAIAISEMRPDDSVILGEIVDNWSFDVANRFIAQTASAFQQ